MKTIRHTKIEDIDEICAVYDSARAWMRANGNLNQWINGHPTRELAISDINEGISYILEDDGVICGVFMFKVGNDKTYDYIEDGKWLNDKPYGVIHRIGSNGKSRGVLQTAVEFCSRFCDNIRIDTAHENHIMQKALEKLGFSKCGVIYIEDGSPRIAYQKEVI